MGRLWVQFRSRASRKEERGHFGLAWSVLAAYFVAGAVLLRSLHPTGWLMTATDIVAILFFILGGLGVYLAFAVPMRWWPHHPIKRDTKQLDAIEALFIGGLSLIQNWGQNAQALDRSVQDGANWAIRKVFVDAIEVCCGELIEWIKSSEITVSESLGSELGNRYKMSPDLTRTAPGWAEDSMYPGLHQNIMGRLGWLRTWSQDQFDL
jgi:hypothetical protein